MPLILALFAMCFVCCLLQFPFLSDVKKALIARHPEVWKDMVGSGLWFNHRLFWFAMNDRAKQLNDSDLVTKARRLKYLYLTAYGAFAAIFITAILRG